LADELAPNAPDSVSPADSSVGLRAESMSPRRMAVRRFTKHRAALVSLIILGIMVLFILLAPFTARYGVNEAVFKTSPENPNSFLSPRGIAWLGTDDIGRDLYSRLIYGLRVSILIGLASAFFGTILGVAIGALAGLRGGWIDDLLMRVTDLFLAFPFLVTLLVLRSVMSNVPWLKPIVGNPTSIRFVVVLFVLFGWMGVARLMRGQVLALKEREFVEAARALGASNTRIVLRHLLPNSAGPILVALTFAVSGNIIAEATLGFFGYGPQPGAGATSLGKLVGSAKGALLPGYWWLVVFPCVILILVSLCVNFVGDGLRDATDPKLEGNR
jgi:peptide/nickel transport system permease protein